MKRVLLIEDDLDISMIYTQALENKGIKVDSASTGERGLLLARKEKPDLILLDIMLPEGMNGFDVLENLKRDENLTGVPVIVLTNLKSEERVAKTMGVVDYLIKSDITPAQVVEKVKKHL